MYMLLTFAPPPLPHTSGGWAGGEASLWQLREQLEREKAAKKAGGSSSSGSSKAAPQVPAAKDGLAPIYLGYGKE
jgi:hypothetical protein